MLTRTDSRGIALARGIIVLLIAPIHCAMLYSSGAAKAGPLGAVMAFFAEYPGAHLFMFLMGAFIMFSKPRTPALIIRRAAMLLLAAYALNALKFLVPHLLGQLPPRFYEANHIPASGFAAYRLFFMNDILHFAAIAYPVCAFIRRCRHPLRICLPAAFIVLAASPLVWTDRSNGGILTAAATGIVGGGPPQTWFPLFPWLFHCLAGMVCAGFYRQVPPHKRLWVFLFAGGAIGLAGLAMMALEPAAWQRSFFRTGPGGSLFHASVALLWIWGFALAAATIKDNLLFRFFRWCSSHITVIYIVQWVLIMWLLPFAGFESCGTAESLLYMLGISLFTLTATYIFSGFKKQRHETTTHLQPGRDRHRPL